MRKNRVYHDVRHMDINVVLIRPSLKNNLFAVTRLIVFNVARCVISFYKFHLLKLTNQFSLFYFSFNIFMSIYS